MADTKDFYYKLYAQEYVTSGEIRALPLEAQGILTRLWCICCIEGSMPEDLEDLSCASGVKLTHLRSHMRSLLAFFCAGPPGRLVSRRMERERAARIKASDGASRAAKAKHANDLKQRAPANAPANAPAIAGAIAPAVYSLEFIVNSLPPEKDKRACGEGLKKPSPPPAEVLVRIECVGQGPKTWDLTEEWMAIWKDAYPALDVPATVKRGILWLRANPQNRKTAKGMPAFFAKWLSSEQNKAQRVAPPMGGRPVPRAPQRTEEELKKRDLESFLRSMPSDDFEYPPDEPDSALGAVPLARGGAEWQAAPRDGKKALSGAGKEIAILGLTPSM